MRSLMLLSIVFSILAFGVAVIFIGRCTSEDGTIEFADDKPLTISIAAPDGRSLFGNSLTYQLENAGPGDVEITVEGDVSGTTLGTGGIFEYSFEFNGVDESFPKTIMIKPAEGSTASLSWNAEGSCGWEITQSN